MIINDSNNSTSRQNTRALDETSQNTKTWVENATKNAMYLDDPATSPANALARIGTPMQASDMEAKLKKLNPSLHFEFNQFNPTKKVIYLLDSRCKTTLFPYEAGLMPERSIMNVKIEEVPKTELFNGRKLVMDRKDFSANGINPYVDRVVIPWSEKVRGWRTVLIKLILAGAITPTQAETEFGVQQSAEWANSLGKASHNLPW